MASSPRKVLLIVLTALQAALPALSDAAEGRLWEERRAAARPQFAAMVPPALSALPRPSAIRPSTPAGVRPTLTRTLSALLPADVTVRRITEAPKGGGPLVVHILDVHRNAEAQAAISRAVTALSAAHPQAVLALEGAQGGVNIRRFTAFSDAAARQAAADTLMQRLELPGPVHAALVASAPKELEGVDDDTLHSENVRAYLTARAAVPREQARIKTWKAGLSERRAKLPAPLATLLDAADAHAEGRLSLGDYVAALATHTRPTRAAAEFLTAWSLERRIDFDRVERERADAVTRMARRLASAALEGLARDAALLRTGRMSHADFYARFKRLCGEAGVSLDTLPALATYLTYVAAAARIDTSELYPDLCTMEGHAIRVLARNEEDRRTALESGHARLAEKLLRFALTPEEWRTLEPLDAEPGRAPFRDFYRVARRRDDAMTDRLKNIFRKHPGAPVILVTGGFHADGIQPEMAALGATVITAVPRLTRVDTGEGSAYLGVFAQEKTPLDQLFHGRDLFLAEPILTASDRARLGAVMAAEALTGGRIPASEVEVFLRQGFGWAGVTMKLDGNQLTLSGHRADGTHERLVIRRGPDGKWADPEPLSPNGVLEALDAFSPLPQNPRDDFDAFLRQAENRSPAGEASAPALVTVRVGVEDGARLPVTFQVAATLWNALSPAAQEKIRRAAGWIDAPLVKNVAGRSIQVHFDHPERIGDQTLEGVELKGLVWLEEGGQPVPPVMESYYGSGRPASYLRFDRWFRPVHTAEGDRPRGTLAADQARAEWEAAMRLSADGVPVDTPLGFGRIDGAVFRQDGRDTPVGFSIRGIESFGRRRIGEAIEHEIDFLPLNLASLDPSGLDDFRRRTALKLERYGRVLRFMHRRGFVHGSPHFNNFTIDENGFLIKDLNAVRALDSLTREEAVARLMNDLAIAWTNLGILSREIEAACGETPDIAAFWRGYFHDTADPAAMRGPEVGGLLHVAAARTTATRIDHPLIRHLLEQTSGLREGATVGAAPAPLPDVRELPLARAIREIARFPGRLYPARMAVNPGAPPEDTLVAADALIRHLEANPRTRIFVHDTLFCVVHPEHPMARDMDTALKDRRTRWAELMPVGTPAEPSLETTAAASRRLTLASFALLVAISTLEEFVLRSLLATDLGVPLAALAVLFLLAHLPVNIAAAEAERRTPAGSEPLWRLGLGGRLAVQLAGFLLTSAVFAVSGSWEAAALAHTIINLLLWLTQLFVDGLPPYLMVWQSQSKRATTIRALGEILESQDHTVAEKLTAIDAIERRPGSGDLHVISRALQTHRNNPVLARRLISSLVHLKTTGVLKQQSELQHSLVATAWQALREVAGKLHRPHFDLVFGDGGHSLIMRYDLPAGLNFNDAGLFIDRLRELYDVQNEYLEPEISVEKGSTSQRGAIRILFRPHSGNITQFERALDYPDMALTANHTYRRLTDREIGDRVEERLRMFLAGMDPASTEYRDLISLFYGKKGDGSDGILAAIRNGGPESDNTMIPIGPNVVSNETINTSNTELGRIRLLAQMLPYANHFIPENDIDEWVFLARGAASQFIAAYLKGFFRNHQESDYLAVVSIETLGERLRGFAGLIIGLFKGHPMMPDGRSRPAVKNFEIMRLAVGQWYRRHYMMTRAVHVGGRTGFIRYRDADVDIDGNFMVTEALPIYDTPDAGARLIGRLVRRRHRDDIPIPDYDYETAGGGFNTQSPEFVPAHNHFERGEWLDNGKSTPMGASDLNAATIEGDEQDALLVYSLNAIYKQWLRAGILDTENNTPNREKRLMVVDEIGEGSYPLLLNFIIETKTHDDEINLPPPAELVELRARDPFSLSEAEGRRWSDLESEYLAARKTPDSVRVGVFVNVSQMQMISGDMSDLPGYPALSLQAIMDRYGFDEKQAREVMVGTSGYADHMPHHFRVDRNAISERPILDENIPLELETPAVQIAAYLKSLLIYNGVVDYYEYLYRDLAVQPLLQIATDDTISEEVREQAAEALAAFPDRRTLTFILDATGAQHQIRMQGILPPPTIPIEEQLAVTMTTLTLGYLRAGFTMKNGKMDVVTPGWISDRLDLLERLSTQTYYPESAALARQAIQAYQRHLNTMKIKPMPVSTFVAMPGDRRQAMIGLGVVPVAMLTENPAEATARAEKMGYAGVSIDESAIGTDGGQLPAVARRSAAGFISFLHDRMGFSARTAVAAWRWLGAPMQEDVFGVTRRFPAGFMSAAWAAGLAAMAAMGPGHEAWLVFLVAWALSRAIFVAMHPRGGRLAPAAVALLEFALLVLPWMIGAPGIFFFVAAATAPLVAHPIVNAVTGMLKAPEDRAAEQTALALWMALKGRGDISAKAINSILRGTSLDLGIGRAGNPALTLESALTNRTGWNGDRFGTELARQWRRLDPTMNMDTALEALYALSAAGDAVSLESALAEALPPAEDAPRFLPVVVTDAMTPAARIAAAKAGFSQRRHAADVVVMLAASPALADEMRRSELGRMPWVRVSLIDGIVEGGAVRLARLPSDWEGRRPSALIVPEGLGIDDTGLDDNSPWRKVAVLVLNAALRAVVIPTLDTLTRIARVIAAQA